MDLLVILAVVAGATALVHGLVVLGVHLAERRTRHLPDAPPPAPDPLVRRHPLHREVGAWSGRTYPRGAVVVGYEGGGHSRAAVAWAAGEAVRRARPLVVVHAADYPGMTGEPGPGLHHRDPHALEASEEITAEGVAEARRAEPSVAVVGATEVTGSVRALTEASHEADLVVVGSRGRGRLRGALRGSVAGQVAAGAHAPVVVVRDRRPQTTRRSASGVRSATVG